MEQCPKCEFPLADYSIVTEECTVELKVTATKDHLGYLVLKHKDTPLGSFELNGEFRYYEYIDKKYLVQVILRPHYSTYFQVFEFRRK